jgi:hypothetical protein
VRVQHSTHGSHHRDIELARPRRVIPHHRRCRRQPRDRHGGLRSRGPPPTARFTVTNNTKDTVTFTGYDSKGGAPWIYEPAVAGPSTGHTLKSGESVWFDVQVWDKGGHATGADFSRGGTGWSVYMNANGKSNSALCVGSCDPIDRTSTTKILLH